MDEIKEFIVENELSDKVIIKGFIEEGDLERLYGEAIAVIMPAKISIAASGPLFHANSYGKCAIASRVGNFLEEIDNYQTGILIENDRWQDAFQYVANHSKEVAIIENNVLKKAKSRSPLIIAQKHYDIYKTMVA